MLKLANNARSTLAASINKNTSAFRIATGDGVKFPSLSGDQWFPVVLQDDCGNVEYMRCIAKSGDLLTVNRATESSTARAFNEGDLVELRLTTAAILEIQGVTPNNTVIPTVNISNATIMDSEA